MRQEEGGEGEGEGGGKGHYIEPLTHHTVAVAH